jgi:biotin carboxyl carrier protein
MHYEVEVNGRSRTVGVTRTGGGFAVEVDGRRRHVDVARIDAHTLSLLIGDLRPEGDGGPGVYERSASYEVALSHPVVSGGALVVHVGISPVAVILNGRRRRADAGEGRAAARGADGALRVVAPMPGKVVRVLVATGDAVRVRQPLVVVEAMKMENELRAGRDGHVTAIHVREGASVDAGTLLIELKS